MKRNTLITFSLCLFFLIPGCEKSPIENFKTQSREVFESLSNVTSLSKTDKSPVGSTNPRSLNSLIDKSPAPEIEADNFAAAIKSAVELDPEIIVAKENYRELGFAVAAMSKVKEFKLSGTVYGGIEDVTDRTSGVAMVLNANRLVFDGGRSDLVYEAEKYNSESVRYGLLASMDQRANYFGGLWIELDMYESLNKELEKRLLVLEPLIKQLEQVAEAGVGDVSRVAAAQKTVSMIKVTKTDVRQKLELARLNFRNAFGTELEEVAYDEEFIRKLIPNKIDSSVSYSAPGIQSAYNSYLASEYFYKAVQLNENLNVGFEARASRPFGGSGYDSDESIGLIATKTLYNGGLLELEISQAESRVNSAIGSLRRVHNEGRKAIESSFQVRDSMDQAIALAAENAKLAEEEIAYLRRQLIIGGSTLDSVLTAEARLYEAQSKEILFIAEKRKAELAIVAALGLLSSALGL